MNVVITGSSKGVGYALAEEFGKYNDRVVISSRNNEAIEKAVNKLKTSYPNTQFFGTTCDVSKSEDVKRLAEFSKEKLDTVDIWINNAGTNAGYYDHLLSFSENDLKQIVETNLLGTLYGCKEALKLMKQQGSGHIFNVSGMGGNGSPSANLAAYGATKSAIVQLAKSLAKENKKSGIGFHVLQPGMTLTDFFLNNISPEAAKIFNILGDTPENVSKFLVEKIRKIKGTGKTINYLSTAKIFWKFMTAGRRKNTFFDSDGNLISE